MDGGQIWWIGLTYRETKRIWRHLKRAAASAAIEKSEQDRTLYFPGGGFIAIKTATNPDDMRGEGLDGVILDEGAFMKSDVWHKVVRPMLSDRMGWALFTTTPNGYNWFKDLFDKAADRLRWARWQLPSHTNPDIDIEEIKEAQRDLSPTEFRQEYLAEFVQTVGVEWPGEYFDRHIWFDKIPENHDCRAITVDPSKGKTDKSDFTAITTVWHTPDGHYWIDAEIDRMDCRGIAQKMVAKSKQLNPHGVGFETNQFQELIASDFVSLAQQANVNVTQYSIENTINKLVRIRGLTSYLSDRKLHFRNNPGTIMLVEQLREFPAGDYDDGPDALEMGIRLTNKLLSGDAMDWTQAA